MNILFVRHGESQDDIDNQYGGWADFPLTSKGHDQVAAKIESIKNLNRSFEKVFSSPLQRAYESAKIIAGNLKLPLEIFEYVKEQNKYGVLTGMKKNEAKNKYPDQVELLDLDKYVDGSERYEDLTARVGKALSLINQTGLQNIIVVTHGNFLKCLFQEVVKNKLTKKEDGGFVLMSYEDGVLKPIASDGIEYENL